MTKGKTKILVLGGGYAGVMAALRLAGKTRRLQTEITLVNGLNHFVERLRLHETVVGKQTRQPAMTEMLRGTAVKFVQGCSHSHRTRGKDGHNFYRSRNPNLAV